MFTLPFQSLFLLVLLVLRPVAGHDMGDMNGMDMGMDMPMELASGRMMMSWFHFTPGDTVWFQGWVPQTVGAMVGACIGLFLFALVERWLSAMRGVMDNHWRARAYIDYAKKMKTEQREEGFEEAFSTHFGYMRRTAPFIPAHDIVRGIMHALQAAIGYALMLAVMTFQASFFIAIVAGLGVGETLFGRFASATGSH